MKRDAHKTKLLTREFLLASAVSFLACLNFFTTMTTMPGYVINVFHLDEVQAGLATGLFVAGMMISRLIAGRLVSHIGFRPMLNIGVAGLVVFSVGYFFAATPFTLFLVRFFNGFFYGMTANTCVTVVTTITPPERSGEGVGYYSMFQMIAWAIGPYLGVELSHTGNYSGVFLFCTVLPAVGLVLIPFLRFKGTKMTLPEAGGHTIGVNAPSLPNPKPKTEQKQPFLEKFFEKKVFPAAASCFFFYLANAAIVSFLPTYSEELNLTQTASFFFLIFTASLLLTRPFVSKMVDMKGTRAVLYPGAVFTVMALLILSQLHGNIMLVIAAIFFGVGNGAMQTATIALSVKLAPRERLGIANATYYMALDCSSALSPVLCGALIPLAGYRGMYLIGGIYAAVGVLLFHLLFGRKLQ
jgi:MFS family permease